MFLDRSETSTTVYVVIGMSVLRLRMLQMVINTPNLLRELEFKNVRPPAAATKGEWGEICKHVEIYLRGEKLEGVLLEVRAYRNDYMLAICAFTDQAILESFKILDLEGDVYPMGHVKIESSI